MPPEPERRQWGPYPADPLVRCELVLAGTVKLVPQAVHNLSAGGLRLALDVFVPAGLEGVARFTDPGERFYCRREFRVAYCREEPGRGYVLGAAFRRDLAPDELERLKRLTPP
jgi:PilZ domain-containing protein